MFTSRLCFAIGKRVFLMRWRHAEEWISLTTETAEGFLLESEFQVHETPHVISILEGGSGKNRFGISCNKIMLEW